MRIKGCFLVAVLFVLASLCGCAYSGEYGLSKDKYNIVCTIFPAYDWTKEIVAGAEDNISVNLLVDNGTDVHNYQATADDIIMISDCDLLICVGGESDAWVYDVVEQSQNDNLKVISLLELVDDRLKEEEVIEGMEAEEESEEEEPEYDEHVWLSLKNADYLVNAIAIELGDDYPDYKELYSKNAKVYCEKLQALDKEYEAVIASSSKDCLLFGDRFPFRYLVDDYKLTYYAAFVGCSAETEASFETVTFLAEKLDECELDYVMVLENGNTKLANTIVDNTKNKNQSVLELDSMQSIQLDKDSEASYLSIMEKNREVLAEALR